MSNPWQLGLRPDTISALVCKVCHAVFDPLSLQASHITFYIFPVSSYTTACLLSPASHVPASLWSTTYQPILPALELLLLIQPRLSYLPTPVASPLLPDLSVDKLESSGKGEKKWCEGICTLESHLPTYFLLSSLPKFPPLGLQDILYFILYCEHFIYCTIIHPLMLS